jgi:hypothetical protein
MLYFCRKQQVRSRCDAYLCRNTVFIKVTKSALLLQNYSSYANAKWPANMCKNEWHVLDVLECCLFFYFRRGETRLRAIRPHFSAVRITCLTIHKRVLFIFLLSSGRNQASCYPTPFFCSENDSSHNSKNAVLLKEYSYLWNWFEERQKEP